MKYHFNSKLWTKNVLAYYQENKRDLPWRNQSKPYPIWISEIMSQQTRLETVIDYFNRFITVFPDIDTLAAAEIESVLKLWEGLGYYSRAKNMHKTAKIIVQQYHSQFPSTYEELINLPGIGPYTASAISSICFGQVKPAIDGNFIRIASRIMTYDKNPRNASGKKWLEEFWLGLIDPSQPGDFNQAIMDLGAQVCLPNGQPLCSKCPVSNSCKAFLQDNPLDYPLKGKKINRKIEKKTILLLKDFDSFAMKKRKNHGLLAGLWEFPNLKGYYQQEEVLAWLKENNLSALRIKKGPPSKHVFSHIEWHMISYEIVLDSTVIKEQIKNDYLWLKEKDLNMITVPSAFKVYLNHLLGKNE